MFPAVCIDFLCTVASACMTGSMIEPLGREGGAIAAAAIAAAAIAAAATAAGADCWLGKTVSSEHAVRQDGGRHRHDMT